MAKRFQVLQLGCCHIGPPTQPLENPIVEHKKTYTRKVLTVQRVKSAKKRGDSIKKVETYEGITNEIQNFLQEEKDSLAKHTQNHIRSTDIFLDKKEQIYEEQKKD